MASRTPLLREYRELDGKTFLIGVGAMRCATSWVYSYLGELREVAVSPLKELHFFSKKFAVNALGDMDAVALKRLRHHMEQAGDAVENLRRRPTFQASVDRVEMIYDDDAYFGHFARLCGPFTRTFCDITPAYAVIGQAGFAYLKDFCASQDIALKLLFVMRDPVDRLWSQLCHMQQLNPSSDVVAKWSEAIQAPRVLARADYRGTVCDLDDVFPAEDVLYLFFEELFTEGSLRRLSRFAEVGFHPGDTTDAKNRAAEKADLPEEAHAAFKRLLAPQYEFCRQRFGDAIPATWQS